MVVQSGGEKFVCPFWGTQPTFAPVLCNCQCGISEDAESQGAPQSGGAGFARLSHNASGSKCI